MSERHVVLVKPGDVLLIGNMGKLDEATITSMMKIFRTLNIEAVGFVADITIKSGIDITIKSGIREHDLGVPDDFPEDGGIGRYPYDDWGQS